jgi:hypothetical protein
MKHLAAASLFLAFATHARAHDVLVVAAASPDGVSGCEFTDVQSKLLGTGFFDSVDLFDAAMGTPTLGQLLAYDSLFVFSNVNFFDRESLGDVLADYVDAGGGVVGPFIPANSFGGDLTLGGRWEAGGYEIFLTKEAANFGTASLGVVPDPGHPVMAGVASFAAEVQPISTTIQPGAEVIAFYSNGLILAVAGAHPRRVDFGFFPPSSDCAAVAFVAWDAETDGARLMANALLYVAGSIPVPYCTAKPNSLGCIAEIGFAGTPDSKSSSGFVVQATNVHNQKPGVLLYSVDGRAITPFQGGVLCLAPKIQRTPPRNSGGSHVLIKNCTGAWRIDMNAFAAGAASGHPDPALSRPGTTVHCQWWGRDPDGVAGTALTDALKYLVAM